MGKGSFFSGLVQGFGGQLAEGYNRKRAQEQQQRQDMFRLLSGALMNDDDLPGSARREGFRQLGKTYGVNIPEEMIAQIVPDVQIETDRFMADRPPEAQPMGDVAMAPMPRSPFGQAAPQQGGELSRLGAPPPMRGVPQSQGRNNVAGGQQQAHAGGQPTDGNGVGLETSMFPMPRNPLVDQPQVIGAQAPTAQSNAPVVQQATMGDGATYDELDLTMKQKQLEAQLSAPPSRMRERVKQSSLGMSRAQIAEMRTKRMQQEQMEREMTMDQLQNTMKLQQAHREQMFQMQMEAPMLQAKMNAITQALGQPLSTEQKGRVLGIGPTGPEMERHLEAQDYIDAATKPNTPEGMAARQRVTERERRATYQLSQIQENMTQIAAQMQALKDPMNNPRLVNSAKVNSAKQASAQWTLSDQQEYLEARTKYWEQQLASGSAATVAGGDPSLTQLLQAASGGQLQARQAAIQLAQKDVANYKQRLADLIFQYGFPSGDKVVTINYVRRRAEEAAKQGLDPNKIWDYWKQNGVILDQNLEIWTQ